VEVESPHGGEEVMELGLDSRYLDHYPMKDGDRIEVQMKPLKRILKQSRAV